MKLTLGPGRAMEIVLNGPERAIEDLIEQLSGAAGKLEVTGGGCCWTLSRGGTTLHLLVDKDKVA